MTRGLRGPAREQLMVELRARYEAGATIQELADEKGRSYGSTRDLLNQSGAQLRKRTQPGVPVEVLQMLHLVDRAADGRLLPAEAQLLRDGITRLAKEASDGA